MRTKLDPPSTYAAVQGTVLSTSVLSVEDRHPHARVLGVVSVFAVLVVFRNSVNERGDCVFHLNLSFRWHFFLGIVKTAVMRMLM